MGEDRPDAARHGDREASLQAILDTAADGIVTIDARGVVHSFNPAASRMFGWAPEEVIGRSVAILMPAPDRDAHDAHIRHYLETGERHVVGTGREVEGVRRDGTRFPLYLAVSEFRDARGRMFTGILHDLTPIRQARRLAEETAARTRLIVDTALDAVITSDERGRVTLWNAQAEATFGWSRDEALGRPMAELIVPPHLREAHEAGMRRYLDTGESAVLGRRLETVAQHRDGHLFPVEVAITPLREADTISFSAFVRDISRRKRNELLLRTQNEVSQLLGVETALPAAARRFLRATCEYLGWSFGALWTVDPDADDLRCVEIWQEPWLDLTAFLEQTRTLVFRTGIGLPGRVVASEAPLWLPIVGDDPHFRRAAAAREGGLQSAIALPIPVHGRVGGVIEFFSRAAARPDATVVDALGALGRQLGQFIERKRAEEALATERAFLTRLIEDAPEAIVVLDPDDRVRLVNAEFTRLFGYEAGEAVGRPINALIVSPQGREHAEHLTRLLGASRVVNTELVRQRKDGTLVDVSLLATPVTSMGRQVAMFAIYRDISARKRAERALHESRQRLELALAGGDLGTWDFEAATGLTTVDARYEAMLGYPARECRQTTQDWLDRLHPEDRERVEAVSIALMRGELDVYESEHRVRHASGKWVWVLDRGRVTERDEQGRPIRASGTHLDITTRKTAEQALRQSETRLASVIDHMLEGLVVLDDRQRIVRANPAFATIFGRDLEQLRGTPIVALIPPPPDHRPDDAAGFLRASLGQVTEREGLRRDGEVFPLQLQAYEVATPEGRYLAAHVTDLTGQREADRLKKRFIASVSHELRTPLTAIRGSLGLLALGQFGDLPAEARDLVGVAERNAVRLVGIINDLLDFERIETGLLSLARRRVPLSRAIARALEAVGPLADESGIVLSAPDTDVEVWADEERLIQVLVNLVGNAIKFSPRASRVDVDAAADGTVARVTVRDRGRGIPPAQQEIIFHPFRQVDESDARRHGGSGVGLAICRAIVAQHGGTIGVDSAPGQGAAFWFTVPLHPGEPPVPARSPA
jgi:PAS domain S-box-containing protein